MKTNIQIGVMYGDLEVLSRAGSTASGLAKYQCLCHLCGNKVIVEGRRLAPSAGQYQKTNCGCVSRQKMIAPGNTYGGITVLRDSGKTYGTNRLWVVRCNICGKEKIMRASSIIRNPKSCGCLPISPEQVKKTVQAAVAVNVQQGTQLYVATKETPNEGNTTGYRWVRVIRKNGKEWIYASFILQGERYYRGGFSTRENAYAWAVDEHARLLKERGISDPRKTAKLSAEGSTSRHWILKAPDGALHEFDNLSLFTRSHPEWFPNASGAAAVFSGIVSGKSGTKTYKGWQVVCHGPTIKKYKDDKTEDQ